MLLDLSAGAGQAPWGNPQWLRGFLAQRLPTGMSVTVVGFGRQCQVLLRDAAVDQAGVWPRAWAVRSLSHAVVSRALEWDRPGLSHVPRWIFTAGLAPWPAVSVENLPFDMALTVVRPTVVDVGVTGLRAVRSAALVDLVATVRCTGADQVMLQTYRNGTLIADQPLVFAHAGLRVVHIQDIPPDDHRALDYSVRLIGADPWPQDNQASIVVQPPHGQSVLIVTRHPGRWSERMRPWRVHVIGPRVFPMMAGPLERYQIVVLSNIPRALLPADVGKTLGDFVTDTGGGLLIAGSCCAFGPGGYAARPSAEIGGRRAFTLERLSPLASAPPNRKPVHVVFLVDDSGSMVDPVAGTAGQTEFNVATHAIVNAVEVLRKTDRVKIFAFNGQTRLLLGGAVGAVRGKIVSRLSNVVPTGSTNPDSALPALRKALLPHSIMVMLTDGRIEKMNVSAWRRLIRTRHIKFVVVAPLSQDSLLTHVAKVAGAIRFSTYQFRRWPAMLRTAMDKEIAGKAQTTPLAWHGDGPSMRGITREWIQVYRKAGVQLLARSNQGNHPLAAVWRLGLGHVAALAFSEKSVAYRLLLEQIFRSIVPPPGNPRFVLSQRRMGRRWRVVAQARDRHGFINGASLFMRVLTSSGSLTGPLPLLQTGPGEYQAQTKLFGRGAVAATVIERLGDREIFIGRLNGPALAGPYFPATAGDYRCPWKKVLRISAAALPRPKGAAMKWRPQLKGAKLKLSPALLWLGIIMVLAVLWAGRLGVWWSTRVGRQKKVLE